MKWWKKRKSAKKSPKSASLSEAASGDEEQPAEADSRSDSADMSIESLEQRIMLSATWVDADGDEIGGATQNDDSFFGSDGVEVVKGKGGDDALFGNGGDDSLSGGQGDDLLQGGAGDDALGGGQGNDLLQGGAGDDALDGGQGDDLLRGGAGDDALDGGQGTDTADYGDAASGVTIDLTQAGPQDTGGAGVDTLSSIERVVGGDHDDSFSFDAPAPGAVYGVDGGGGSNSIDLGGVQRDAATFENGLLVVDLGDGQSFSIEHENVDQIQFSDKTVNFVTWDGEGASNDWSDATNWSGDAAPGADDILIFDASSSNDAVFDDGFSDTIGGLIVDEGYGGDLELASDLTIAGDLVLEGGHFDAQEHSLSVEGNLDISGGRFDGGSGTITVGGDFSANQSSFRAESSTLVFSGGDDQTIDADGVRFNDLHIDKAGGSLTFGSDFVVQGDLVHNAGTVDAGTSSVEFQGRDTNLDTGSIQFHDVVIETSGHTTFQGTLDVEGHLTIERADYLDGGEITVAGDVTTLDAGVYGSATVVLDGAGDQTIDAGGGVGELHDLRIDKATGTLVLTDHIQLSGDLTHVQGAVDTSAAVVEFQGRDTTLDVGSIQFQQLVIETSGHTTFQGTLDVEGHLTIERADYLDGAEITVAGDVTTLDAGVYGSATVVLDGAGDQTIDAGGGVGELHDLRIDKAAGTLVLTDHIQLSGDLTHVQGAVDTSAAVVEFQGRDTTLDVGSIQFQELVIETSGHTTFQGTLDVEGHLTIERADYLDGGEITVAGDVTTLDAGVYGSATVVLDGAGDQTIDAGGGVGELHDLRIDKAAGTLVLTDHIQLSGDLTHVQGAVDTSAAVVELQGRDTTLDVGSIQFQQLVIETSGHTTFQGTLDVEGHLTIERADYLDGAEITVAGDVTTLDAGVYGSATVVLDGAGDQTIDAGGGVGELHDLRIDKAAGTLVLTDHIQLSGDLTHVQGAVDTSAAVVEFQGRDTTLDVGSIQFQELVIETSGHTTFQGTLDVEGHLTIERADYLDGGEITVSGDVTTLDAGVYGSATVVLDGAGDQTIDAGGGVGELHDLRIDKAEGTLILTDHIQLSGDLTHVQGAVDTSAAVVEFQGRDTTLDVGSIQFQELVIETSGHTTFEGTLDVDGHLTIERADYLDGGSITVAGDVTSLDSGVYGNASVVLDGAGDQTLSGGDLPHGDLTVDKPSGSVVLGADLHLEGAGQNLNLVSGSLDLQGHALEVEGIVDVSGGALGGAGTITGDVHVSSGGAVQLSVGGFEAGQSEALVIEGRLELGVDAHLSVDLSALGEGGGELSDILVYQDHGGDFASFEVVNLSAGLEGSVQVAAGDTGLIVTLEVESANEGPTEVDDSVTTPTTPATPATPATPEESDGDSSRAPEPAPPGVAEAPEEAPLAADDRASVAPPATDVEEAPASHEGAQVASPAADVDAPHASAEPVQATSSRALGLSPLPDPDVDLSELPGLLPGESFEEVFEEIPVDEEELASGALPLNLAGDEELAAGESADQDGGAAANPHPSRVLVDR